MRLSGPLKHTVMLCALLCFAGGCSKGADVPSVPIAAVPEAISHSPASDTAEETMAVEEDDPFEEFEEESEAETPPPVVESKEGIDINAKVRLPKYLAVYNLFKDPAKQIPNAGLIPYYLNTGHFSDYADVKRFIWIPPGTRVTFQPTGRFTFPAGTALIQTFSYPQIEEPAKRRLVETRVLLNQPGKGWNLSSYKWDESGAHARKAVAGGLVPVSYLSETNNVRDFDYLIPNKNDCKRCHENEGVVLALGLTARNLNREVNYGDGPENQLDYWKAQGMLEGLPEDRVSIEKGPRWNDPETGSVTERARMWLDVNCAHCHNPQGAGAVSGLDLSITQKNPVRWGAYKPPVAAGRASEGLHFSIDPGSPETSFLIRRLRSTDPSVMMPPVGRMTVSTTAVELISAWIASLSFDEAEARQMILTQEEALKKLQEEAKLELRIEN